ncbi:PAS domain S-box protein [Sulfurimonas sp. HSL-1716]|uniref:sensor domain-containing protein n=1 Tax=Hydrocurvibacter sulfurireducens TaxID=3131937 RepID=UPI0031F8CF92
MIKRDKKVDIVLCEKDRKLELFIEFAPFAMAMLNKEMKYIAVSKRWITDYDLAGKDIIGKSHYDIFSDIPKHWKEAYEKALKGESTKSDGEIFTRKDGSEKWLRWETHPWFIESGEIGGIIIFSEDITKHKEAEERYHTLFSRTGTCMAIIESDGTFSLVNKTFADLAHCRVEELIGSSFIDLIDDTDKKRVYEYHKKRLSGEKIPEHYELAFVTKDKKKGVGLLNAVFLPETSQTLVSLIDITDRKRAENDLREKEQELNDIIDNIPMMIFIKRSDDLRYVRFNKAGEKLTGISKDVLLGKNDYDFFLKEEADFFTSRDREVLEKKTVLDIKEEPIHTQSGERVLHTKKVAIVDDSGEAKYLLGISEDITEKKRIEDTLKQEYKRSSLILESTLDGYIMIDLSGTILDVNTAYCNLVGYTKKELVSKKIDQLVLSKTKKEIKSDIKSIVQNGHGRFEIVHAHKDGHVIDMDVKVGILHEEDKTYMIAFVRDISEQKEKERQLLQSSTAFENLAEGIIITDAASRIITVNPAFTEITGYEKEEVIGKDTKILRSGKHDYKFYKNIWDTLIKTGKWQGEIWNKRKNGQNYPEWLSISCIKNEKGETINYIAVFADISKIKKTEDELRFLAHYDALTHLPNRLLLNERLEHSLERSHRKNESIAVLYLDIDRFKEINDSLGHPYGDLLLKKVSKKISELLRDEDTVARVSGDEFVMVIEDLNSPNDAAIVAQKILVLLNSPVFLKEHEVTITASIGIAISPMDGEDAVTLLKNADTALYRAKELGRNSFEFFSADMASSSFDLLYLHSALHNALNKEEFLVYYQPQYEMKTGKILGAEALVRWNSPEMGLVSPIRFIPLAEDTGLIVPLGEWILRQACFQMKKWLDEGRPLQYIAVNVSGRQLAHNNIIETIKKALQDADLDPKYIEIEITESVIMKDELYIDLLNSLKEIGIRLSIDDFGTGYSSLSRLKHLPIDKLKIDQSFVSGIPFDKDDMNITQAIIGLAKSLNLDVIAEGVETKEQADFLIKEGCKKVQGYLYSLPLTASELEKWMNENTRKIIK